MKNIRVFYLKKFSFLEVKFSIYLNRRVFVMIKFVSFMESEILVNNTTLFVLFLSSF